MVTLNHKCQRVNEWLLFNANSTIFLLYHDENKLIFNEIMMRSALYKTNMLSWCFIVLAHWNYSPRIDMLPRSDTLSWFRANPFLLFLLNAACFAEIQQIPIWSGFEPRIYRTRGEHAALTITLSMRSDVIDIYPIMYLHLYTFW